MTKLDRLKEQLDDWAFDTFPTPIYRIPRRIKDFFYSIKYFFQKVFRKHHTSDMELWNLYFYLAKTIYPKFKAFTEMNQSGYPSVFCDYNENEWKNKEEYDKAVKEGKILGGGEEAWKEVQKEILFAFEYVLHDDDSKKIKNFYRKWNIENPHDKIEKNVNTSYWYKDKNRDDIIMGSKKFTEEEMNEKGYTLYKVDKMHYNVKLEHQYMDRAMNGFSLFGKYFMNFWD